MDDELTDDDVRVLKRMAEAAREQWPDRRAMLKAASVGAVGFGIGSAATGTALAQPTGDEGQVGTQANPAEVWASEIDASEVTTESLVIGGTLYERDGSIDVSSTESTTYTVNGEFKEVIFIADPGNNGFDELQVNGDAGSNYDYVDSSDSSTTGQSEFIIQRPNRRRYLQIRDNGSIVFATPQIRGGTNNNWRGINTNLGGNGVNQFTLADTGSSRSTTGEVYGRQI
jgi:hypothetical protein